MAKFDRNLAWREAIATLGLDEQVEAHGVATISASELRRFGEPRLMAKMDSPEDVPQELARRGWVTLSKSNTEYLVGPLSIFLPLEQGTLEEVSFVWDNESSMLDPFDVTSESQAALIAWRSGVLDDFLGTELNFSGFGRQRADHFELSVDLRGSVLSLEIEGAQFEVDAAYEGSNAIAILEMKAIPVSSANLRQLYFPFRYWSDHSDKIVYPIFGIWLGRTLELHLLEFEFFDYLNSARVVKSRRYTFDELNESIGSLELLATVSSQSFQVNSHPFPQADKVDTLLSILEDLPGGTTVEEQASKLTFDVRQAGYYLNALAFLGLAKKSGDFWFLDQVHQESRLKRLKPTNAQLLVGRMLRVPEVADAFIEGNRYGRGRYSLEFAHRRLSASSWASGLSEETIKRRSRTIVNWCRWIDFQAKN
jgi:hypothetical protein